ncbi:MAG: SPASM domain-containing protein [Patescibacteria group bacterium]
MGVGAAIKEVKRYKSFTGRHCLAGVTTLTIAANGDIRPCSHLDVSYGNIADEELNNIWNRMQEWRTGNFLPSSCRSCNLLTRCGGGCRMEAKMRNGSFATLDPYAEPKDIDYVINQYSSENDQAVLSLPFYFRLSSRIRWRSESFGAVVFLGAKFACYLNNVATELLRSLDVCRVYQLKDFSDRYGIGAEKFLTKLYNKQILVSD